MTVHATGDYMVTASLDRTWAFYDVQAQICLTQVSRKAMRRRYLLACGHSLECRRVLKASPFQSS